MRTEDDDVTDPAVLPGILPAPERGPMRPGPRALEVVQLWGDTPLDAQHFRPGERPITVGASVGWRWSLLGVHLATVPDALAPVVKYLPPLLSDVETDWRADFCAEDDALDGPEHVLVAAQGDRSVLRIATGWTGCAWVRGERVSFEELGAQGRASLTDDGWEVPMSDEVAVLVRIGVSSFYARLVPRATRIDAAEEPDWPFAAIVSCVAFLGAALALVLMLAPAPPQSEFTEVPDRFVQLMLQAPVTPPEVKAVAQDVGAAKAPKEEGRTGKPDAKLKETRGGAKSKLELDRAVVENAGLLGMLAEHGGADGAFGSGLNRDLIDGIGGLHGPVGTRIGNGGLGERGRGPGGGGVEGTEVAVAGLCDTCKPQGGIGNGDQKREGAISGPSGDPFIMGGLPRSVIDEVVKSHLGAIRYCYERSLQRKPDLSGKVVVKFTIAGDGSVSTANTDGGTLGDAEVESCIAGRFLRMQFPKPKGGGVVIVKYPFLFTGSR